MSQESSKADSGLSRTIVHALVLAMAIGLAPAMASEESSEESDAALVDLGGREIVIAVENAYLPFNYIDPNTGEAAGWDYEAWDAICALLNCTPVLGSI